MKRIERLWLKKRVTCALVIFLLVVLLSTTARATQVEINGPTGSVAFGAQVVVLPNGNIVVTDSNYGEGAVSNVGAVYLYDGATLALISTLKGSTTNDQVGFVTVLANGNFVVTSPAWDNGAVTDAGAVTFCNAVTGCNGTVSPANSLVGSSAADFVGTVSLLPNGNYVVRSDRWDRTVAPAIRNVGAVTFCNGMTGCAGAIGPSNSLVGSQEDDEVGRRGITILANGNFVVYSPLWDQGIAADAGAVTFCGGETGCAGEVSAANSLVGERRNESIGSIPEAQTGVFALTNGNYVVASAFYNPNSINNPNPFGAVTFCDGDGGCMGTVASNNSLVGSGNGQGVGIGGVTTLPNGNYVVNSPRWDDGAKADVGAVTFCDGATGCGGTINPSNSLIGSAAFDTVGKLASEGYLNPVRVLADGSYVVASPNWDNGATADVGAVTWCSGTTGCAGAVAPANSLIGSTANDQAGSFSFAPAVYALKNGDYVVNSPRWDNPSPAVADVGAVTLCRGATNSCANTVISLANSLVGSRAGDFLGSGGTTALTNGNYVVNSLNWDNGAATDAGAVTFCNMAGGCTGPVSPSNSLVGSKAGDAIGSGLFGGFGGVTALPNGSYLVASPNWDDGATPDAGAVTFCGGSGGCAGVIGAPNSLIGSRPGDRVGFGAGVVTVLLNGNYIVSSPNWDNGAATDAGAVTFCDGAAGCRGAISASNSLVGANAADRVGNSTRLLNGNYVVQSPGWDNGGAAADAGAVTFGDGTRGMPGAITSDNSVLGTASGSLYFSYDAVRNRLFVGRRANNAVSILFFETVAVADGDLSDEATWSDGAPGALTNAIIPAGRTVTVSNAATVGGLSVAGGANLVMNADLRLTGGLTLGTRIDTGARALALSCTSGATGAPFNYVVGNLEKNFCAEESFSYPTGTASGYSPVGVTVTALGEMPSSLTVRTNQGIRAGMDSAQSARKFWTLTEAGDLTANLAFNYLAGDVAGDEPTYQLYKWEGATATVVPGVLDVAAHRISAADISEFSDWAIGNLGGSSTPDADGDGVADDADNCPSAANPDQRDTDGDGRGDACDACADDPDNDADGDGACGNVDNCPTVANADQADDDGDGRGNVCEACPLDAANDVDGDGVCGDTDNCPVTTNTDQTDSDADGSGDACDPDDDNDGVADTADNCRFVANPNQSNSDGDTLGDFCDPDDDNDGVPDNVDNCPLVPNPAQANADGDDLGDACDSTPNGDIQLVFSSNRDGNFEIYGMRTDGTGVVRLTNNGATDLDPALSPDKTKIIFTSNRDGNFEIHVMNADGTGVTRLTNNSAIEGFAAWSPTGAKIAFTSTRDGNSEIYSMNANGTGVMRLTNHPKIDGNPSWSPNGGKIAFVSTRHGNLEIYSMNANGTGVTRLTNHEEEDAFPTWSPDSTKIAFMSTRSGNAEIYVMNANGTGLTRLTTNSAVDAEPAWNANGKIAFTSTRDGETEIYSMNAAGTGLVRLTTHSAWDISPHW